MNDFIEDPLHSISCSVCRNEFNTPKVLACWHTFCLKCLVKNIPENSITLVCPTCSMPSILPIQGASGLQDNWVLKLATDRKSHSIESSADNPDSPSSANSYSKASSANDVAKLTNKSELYTISLLRKINKLSDMGSQTLRIKKSLEEREMNKITNYEKDSVIQTSSLVPSSESEQRSLRQVDTASTSAIVMDDTETSRSYVLSSRSFRSSPDFTNDRALCRVHPSKPLLFYCCQWDLPMCASCPTDGHVQHDHINLDRAVRRQKKELDYFVNTIEKKSETLKLSKSFVLRIKSELEENYNEAKNKATHSFEYLQKLILERFESCLQEIDVSYERKNDVLDKQLQSLDNLLHEAQACHNFAENVLESDRNETVLLASKVLSSVNNFQNNTNLTKFTDSLRPTESSFIAFDSRNVDKLMDFCEALSGIVAERQNFSKTITLSKDDLNKHYLEGNLIKLGLYQVGDDYKWVDNFKEKVSRSIYAEVFLPNGKRIIANAAYEPVGAKIGELQFTINHSGTSTLEIFTFGCPINGSPYEITVSSAISSLPPRTRQSLEKYKSFPSPNRTSIPISIRNTGSKLPVYKTSNLSLNRPRWNSSSHLSSALKRSTSFLAFFPQKSFDENRRSLTDLTKAQQSDFAASKFYGDLLAVRKKIEMEAKIEEEPEFLHPAAAVQRRKIDINIKQRILGRTKLMASKSLTQPNSTRSVKRELPVVRGSLSKIETLLLHKPLTRTLSLRYTSKTILESSHMCRIIGRKGTQVGEFSHVQGVSFRKGLISVADSKNRVVQIFSYKSGSVVKKFDCHDITSKTGSSPIAVTQDSQKRFYVSDFSRGSVIVFDEDGKMIKKIGQNTLLGPKGILLDSQENLVVVDTKSCSVHLYCSQTGELLRRFGSRGYSDTELCGPHFCAMTLDERNVIVSDFSKGKVKVFTLDGNLVRIFGSHGLKQGHMKKPTGVAVDPKTGNIIVADFELSKIQVFTGDGQFVKVVDTSSSPLSGPLGICLTDDGHVIVADSGNHCLKIFSHLA